MSLNMTRGDTGVFLATITQGGQPKNLGGAVLTWTACDQNGNVVLTHSNEDGKVVINAAAGTATLTIPSSDTEGFTGPQTVLYWRWVLVDVVGHTTTLEKGQLVVTA